MKNLSTRFTVVSKAKGGSAIDKASYFSREELFYEYDGIMHRPDKTTEDLVHAEVSLLEIHYNFPPQLTNQSLTIYLNTQRQILLPKLFKIIL